MKSKDLIDLILSLTQDVVFEYEGAVACINPCTIYEFIVGYDNKVKTYNNIDDLMGDHFYHGKSLSEIAEKIDID